MPVQPNSTGHDPNSPYSDVIDPEESDDGSSLKLLDLALALSARLRLLFILPLLVGCLCYALTFAFTPVFTARTVILPPQQQQSAAAAALQSLGAVAGLAGAAGNIKSPAEQYVSLAQSRTILDRLVDQYDLLSICDKKLRVDARKCLEQRTRITTGKKDGLITIEVDDVVPLRAVNIANSYVTELRRLISELALTEAQQRRAFFARQLATTRERLATAQKALQSSGFNEGALRSEPRAAAESYARLRAETTSLEVKLQALRVSLTDSAPEVLQIQEQLKALRNQLDRSEAANSKASQGDYVDKYREFKYQEALFESFSKQFELARIDESREGAVVQVVDIATLPERKSWPKRIESTAIGVAIGLFFAICWAIIGAATRTFSASTTQKLVQLKQNIRSSVFLSN